MWPFGWKMVVVVRGPMTWFCGVRILQETMQWRVHYVCLVVVSAKEWWFFFSVDVEHICLSIRWMNEFFSLTNMHVDEVLLVLVNRSPCPVLNVLWLRILSLLLRTMGRWRFVFSAFQYFENINFYPLKSSMSLLLINKNSLVNNTNERMKKILTCGLGKDPWRDCRDCC